MGCVGKEIGDDCSGRVGAVRVTQGIEVAHSVDVGKGVDAGARPVMVYADLS